MKTNSKTGYVGIVRLTGWLQTQGREYVGTKTILEIAEDYRKATGVMVARCSIAMVLRGLDWPTARQIAKATPKASKAAPITGRGAIDLLARHVRNLFWELKGEVPMDLEALIMSTGKETP